MALKRPQGRKPEKDGTRAPGSSFARDASLRDQLLALMKTDPAVREEFGRLILESAVMQELKSLREDMNRRFDSVDRRFEEMRSDMDRRFEAVDRRFEAVDKRFEAIDKRFEAIDKRFEAVDRRFEAILAELKASRDSVSALGSRWGIQTEEAVLTFAREFIGREFGVRAERWTHGDSELDVVVRDGRHCVIEVTSRCDEKALRRFLESIAAYERQAGHRPARKMVVTAHVTSAAWKLAGIEGVEVFTD